MDLLRQTLMKQMISTIHKNASIAAPATGTIQVQDRSAVIKPTMTCAIVIISCCLMWKRRYWELSELLASRAMMMPMKLSA